MKYLILIYSNPQSRALWEEFSDAERAEGFGAYAALQGDLAAAGELVAAEALADVSLARRVTARDGKTRTADGPYAEVKEHLAGFFLVDCDSQERALAVAGRVPEAEFGLVEVRPVMDLGGMEM